MEYIIGALTGALIFTAGGAIGYVLARFLAKPTATTRETIEKPELSEAERLLIAQEEARAKQWDNLMNYNGKAQVVKSED